MPLLKLDKVNTFIDSVHVLRDISLEVAKGDLICLLGRNGAGKTSTIRTIIGLLKNRSGKIIFKGDDITKLPPHKRARLGIGLAPDYRGIFTDLTVSENLQYPKWIIGKKIRKDEIDVDFEKEVFHIFPELDELKDRDGLVLSGGEGKMVATARALMLRPSLLLLDEPLEGLAPVIKSRFADRIKKIRELGVSIITAESNIVNASKIADNIYVIERGEVIYRGDVKEISKNKTISSLIGG
ncbi:ABC transporter ATP-binding protein [[Eubacterium] cellulosolvens]